MPEAGGTATQAGIFYQNSVAALRLVDMLDLDPRLGRERITEVRVEAPQDVDDIVVEFADTHREFCNVKLSIHMGNVAWSQIWQSFDAQFSSADFRPDDRLVLVVGERSVASKAVADLCDRASSSVDAQELAARLSRPQRQALDSIADALNSSTTLFELLARTTVRHIPLETIEHELGRRRIAGGFGLPSQLLSILRDIVGGDARRRGLFRSAPLRRRLKLQYAISLDEPREWGLPAYRATIKRLSRIEVPGTGFAGASEELFVWPRVIDLDRSRPTGFEDEAADVRDVEAQVIVDLQAFPTDELNRVVVVAGPGFGKSALLSTIAGRLAEGPLVPVSVPLAALAAADASVMSFLAESISQEMDLAADWQMLAEQGLLSLLFDGLDEVPSSARPKLLGRISTFSARYPHAPWMLTVRDPAVVVGLSEARLVELLPLEDEDIQRFADTMKKRLKGVDGWDFVRRLGHYPDLKRLARIPLFLAILLTSFDPSEPLPGTRSDLIEAYLRTLFSPEQHKSLRDPADRTTVLRQIAEKLAFERLERQEIGATEREVRAVAAEFSASTDEADQLFARLKSNGVLKPQGLVRLQFPYPIVQEYLAGCYLVDNYPETIDRRIDDAIQRPWAQVIQFALELHPAPQPILEAMFRRPDDAFCSGLRLVGRCVANGAKIDGELRRAVADRLVEYWIHAPTDSRERVGRLLADGFADPLPDTLRSALKHRWLINYGAGEIVSKRKELTLTLCVANALMDTASDDTIHIYRDLQPAFDAAGDELFRAILARLDAAAREETLIGLSSLLTNFSTGAVTRDLAMSMARNIRLPPQARMRAYELAGAPLEDEGVLLARFSFRHPDWNKHYEARDLIKIHSEPDRFLLELLRDVEISRERRIELASDILRILPKAPTRMEFARSCIEDDSIDAEIRLALQLHVARCGDRAMYGGLVGSIGDIPLGYAARTIALFGHFRDAELARKAAEIVQKRSLDSDGLVQIAHSVPTGMLYVFEMDFGFGGTLRPALLHPGTAVWTALLESWVERNDLSSKQRLELLTQTAQLGSDLARAQLKIQLQAIEDMDAPEWSGERNSDHTLSSALRQVQRSLPSAPALVEKVLASDRYNIVARGVEALVAKGDETSLKRLISLHVSKTDWHIRDNIANAIELLAARQNKIVRKIEGRYEIFS